MARTLALDLPSVGWSSGFSPKMSSLPGDEKCQFSSFLKLIGGKNDKPKIATTVSILSISIVPRAMKYNEVKTSP